MPIPQPQAGETQDDFTTRCMGNETMVNDFPDEAQRYAVCIDQVKKDNIQRAIKEFTENLNK